MENTNNVDKTFVTMGASNHSKLERVKDDFYATDPVAVPLLLNHESFRHNIWECACGDGALSKTLSFYHYNVISSDIVDRGLPDTKIIDFLECGSNDFDADIITNPPYQHSADFVRHALDISEENTKIAMFLKLQFLESLDRRNRIFNTDPPKTVYVFSKRIRCYRNGEYENFDSSAIAFAWFVWVKGFKGNPQIKWL